MDNNDGDDDDDDDDDDRLTIVLTTCVIDTSVGIQLGMMSPTP